MKTLLKSDLGLDFSRVFYSKLTKVVKKPFPSICHSERDVFLRLVAKIVAFANLISKLWASIRGNDLS